MGRNKEIKMLHELTGEPYSVLRKTLKANGWNSWRALCYIKGVDPDWLPEFAKKCEEFVKDFVEVMRPLTEAIADFVKNFTEAITEAGLDLLEIGETEEGTT